MIIDCKHGHLARSCEVCQLEAQLAETRAALEKEQADHHATAEYAVSKAKLHAEAYEALEQAERLLLRGFAGEAAGVLNAAITTAREALRLKRGPAAEGEL